MAGGRPRSVGALGRIAVRLRAVHDGAQLPHGPSKVHLLRTDGGTWNFGVRSVRGSVRTITNYNVNVNDRGGWRVAAVAGTPTW